VKTWQNERDVIVEMYLLFFTGGKFIAHLFIKYPISISRDIILFSACKTSRFWLCSISLLDKIRHLFLGESTMKLSLRPPRSSFAKLQDLVPLESCRMIAFARRMEDEKKNNCIRTLRFGIVI